VVSPIETIKHNIDAVREKISSAAAKSGRNPNDILLMGVSKFQPLESIYAARDCGLALFGENRVQEHEKKLTCWEGARVECHMIGDLQKNKVRKALKLFDCVQSVGSIEIVLSMERALSEDSEGAGGPYPVMIEVNVSGEETKHGISPEKSFVLIEDIAVKCPHIEIKGLMTIGPLTNDEKKIGASFETLRKLRDDAGKKFGLAMTHLSMGMSGDYALAIAEGSTIVRIGSAIFGTRGY
jgi:pyridoxal phosphate enzyme (YggS family)